MSDKHCTEPVFFQRNRVFRVYTGGELYRDFLGDQEGDGYYPEEWIASSVRAINSGHTDPLEGISITEDGVPFNELLDRYHDECLGNRKSIGVLVKFLDSAIRLPVQVHPTREFSAEYFHSPFGKAESWLILATRPGACIYFGFRNQISYEDLLRAVEENEHDPDSLARLVNCVPVKEGDVFFVPAGMIHAIGAGCLLLEAQEPTDFTIQPEARCGNYKLNEEEKYISLDKETALKCFDLTTFGDDAIMRGRKEPKLKSSENGILVYSLIGKDDTPCFTVDKYHCSGNSVMLRDTSCVYIVTKGSGKLTGREYSRDIHQGDYFFLPFVARDYSIQGDIDFVCCAGGDEP